MTNNVSPINVNVTDKDIIICPKCKCGDFTPTIVMARVQTPVIGSPKKNVQIGTILRCAECNFKLTEDSMATKGEGLIGA